MSVLTIGALALWRLFGPAPDSGEWAVTGDRYTLCGQRPGSPACVVDGDTVRIGQRRIRLTGFDAPEMDGACAAERTRALAARGELAAWLNAGPFELDGGGSPPRDKYGRELRAARRGLGSGQFDLLADHMIAADLAADNGWFDERDWCDG